MIPETKDSTLSERQLFIIRIIHDFEEEIKWLETQATEYAENKNYLQSYRMDSKKEALQHCITYIKERYL